jgi:tRNA pseudouridine38-40 synthase
MGRYFIELCYQGTAYHGFQEQENANTIQGELSKALTIFYRERFEITGSSRTDAGVHARQNYFHLDTNIEIDDKHMYNINALLPPDIAVRSIREVGATAHCRFDAVARSYTYCIYGEKDPFMRDRGWFYPYPLDISIMQEAASLIKEYHDFTSFSKRNTQVYTFNCDIMESRWEVNDNREKGAGYNLMYHVKANRFLRGMVRGLVATMVKLGRGQIDLAGFRHIIEAKDCTKADFSSPPQGLCLERVWYP